MTIQTDPLEIAVVAVASAFVLSAFAAARRAYVIWRLAMEQPFSTIDRDAMRAIGMRRVRRQSFYLTLAISAFVSWTVCLFYPDGEVQAAVRNTCVIWILLALFYLSTVEHLEQRTADSNAIDREPGA